MGNAISNFFEKDAMSAWDGIKGIFSVVPDVFKSIGGDNSGWAETGRDWQNYGQDVASAVTGKQYGRAEAPQSDLDRMKNLVSSTNVDNSALSRIGHGVVYSKQGVGGGITPPHSLAPMVDPTTRLAMATLRGQPRKDFLTNSYAQSAKLAGVISGQTPVGTSTGINGAGGGSAPVSSIDTKNQLAVQNSTGP